MIQAIALLLIVGLAGFFPTDAAFSSPSPYSTPLNVASSFARINSLARQLGSSRSAVTPPTILPQFTATMDVGYVGVKLPTAATNLTFDQTNMHMLMNYTYYFYGATVAIQEYSTYNSTWINKNGQCELLDKEFADLFGWVSYAAYGGTDTINGLNCQEWYLTLPDGRLSLYTNGSIPVKMTVPIGNSAYEVLEFSNVRSGVPSEFKVPKECFHVPTCPTGGVSYNYVYNIHGSDASLTNANAASALGEATYLCVSGYYFNNSYISQYSVAVNTTWGQYRICENGVCGGSQSLVGHQASFGIGEQGLQCDLNSKYGDWFSFDSHGQCTSGATQCTWTLMRTYKTISMKCLVETLDFHSACQKDGGFPFTKASSVLQNAFTLNDPSQGGCPNVNPSSVKDVIKGLKFEKLD